MTSTNEDIYTIALDMLDAAVSAPSSSAGREAARAIASNGTADDMRRVASLLAMLCTRRLLPPSTRRGLPAWIERMRFEVMAHAADPDSGLES